MSVFSIGIAFVWILVYVLLSWFEVFFKILFSWCSLHSVAFW